MIRRDLVAVGGSAGGVEALKCLVAGLPADLPATVLVALHLPPDARSLLPDVLARRTPLRVVEAVDGLPVQPGLIVVARPGRHLLVIGDEIRLGLGARENGYRPSHDAMLRSAAVARGSRSIGVVLTGLLDDGAAGLHVLRRYGGACVVQEPSDAEFPSMPEHALVAVPDALRVPVSDMAKVVTALVTDDAAVDVPDVSPDQQRADVAEVQGALGASPPFGEEPVGAPSPYSCPDCAGVLNWVPDEGSYRFRCRTGHARRPGLRGREGRRSCGRRRQRCLRGPGVAGGPPRLDCGGSHVRGRSNMGMTGTWLRCACPRPGSHACCC